MPEKNSCVKHAPIRVHTCPGCNPFATEERIASVAASTEKAVRHAERMQRMNTPTIHDEKHKEWTRNEVKLGKIENGWLLKTEKGWYSYLTLPEAFDHIAKHFAEKNSA